MSDKSNGTLSVPGLGVSGLLGVAFVVLRLCNVIDWSWWWVTCPFWGPWVLVIGVLIAVVVFAVGAAMLAAGIEWLEHRGRK